MPDTSHCCCPGCVPCDPVTVTVTDADTGLPLRYAQVGVWCGGVHLAQALTNASGQATIAGLCECAEDGEVRVCRLCYAPQAIPFDPCPDAAIAVALVPACTQPTIWVTNDTPYNYIWDGSAWVPDPTLPPVTIELNCTEFAEPEAVVSRRAWVGCGAIPMQVSRVRDTYGGGCELAGFYDGTPIINVVLSCDFNASGRPGLGFYWISSDLDYAQVPWEGTGCFDWEADPTYDGSRLTSMYGVEVPPCVGNLTGYSTSGAFAPCEWLDGTLFNMPGGPPGRYWVLRTTDPGTP